MAPTPYPCPEPGCAFVSLRGQSKLQHHWDKEHATTKQYTCKYCPNRFQTKQYVADHIRRCCANAPAWIIAYYRSGSAFPGNAGPSGNAPPGNAPINSNRCEFCLVTFADNDALLYHWDDDACPNPPAFRCDSCGEPFDDKEAHLDHIFAPCPEDPGLKVPVAEGGLYLAPNQCFACHAQFTSGDGLLQHYHACPKEQTTCQNCGEEFADSADLMMHTIQSCPH